MTVCISHVRRILGVAFVLALMLGLSACRERTAATQVKNDPFLRSPTHVSYNVEIMLADSSYVRARVQADVGRVREDVQQTELVGNVSVVFYQRRSNVVGARLRCDSVVIDDRTRDMTAFGSVVVVSDSTQTTLRTSKLTWSNAAQRVRSDQPVQIDTPSEHIDGIGFESDQYLTDYRIFRVRGVHQQ